MIDYGDGYFGLHVLFRVDGSAAYKSVLLALFSCSFYVLMYHYIGEEDFEDHQPVEHPYAIAALITGYMFLLASKVTFSYNRFWEACNALHNMHSKWLDIGSTLTAYHLQSKAYEKIRPPAFGEYQEITETMLERERTQENSPEEQINRLNSIGTNPIPPKNKSLFGNFLRSGSGSSKSEEANPDLCLINSSPTTPKIIRLPKARSFRDRSPSSMAQNGTNHIQCSPMLNGGMKGEIPSLLLQEGAHLVSLLSAVALSTLRNDIEGAEAPLAEFVPGRPWPAYNSDEDPDMRRYGLEGSHFLRALRYMFDVSRTDKERAIYNAARPFHVIGGISDAEALLLQNARGPTAKLALINVWLNEFVLREHLHGSTGNVGPPIISRLQQYQSDGFLWYNSARKMSYIPFPFPHAQITIVYVILCTLIIPLLMLSFAKFWSGLLLNFCTVVIFAGLNEVSKELENPFRNAPNDLPLNLFQAQFNEALVTMFAGYHPDSWWELKNEA